MVPSRAGGGAIVVTDTATIGAAYGLSWLAIGLFAMLAGIAESLGGDVDRVHRHVPIVVGLYVLVPMMPIWVDAFVRGQLVIADWMVLFVLLGHIVLRSENS
ncbi:hypothetical protein [Kribbella sp. CA-294648]|uniref:hypothetical protein n=1 Tax=Kribbella sp. CA-294648 TaxID=3239948 RepID=UPI003D910336